MILLLIRSVIDCAKIGIARYNRVANYTNDKKLRTDGSSSVTKKQKGCKILNSQYGKQSPKPSFPGNTCTLAEVLIPELGPKDKYRKYK